MTATLLTPEANDTLRKSVRALRATLLEELRARILREIAARHRVRLKNG